MATSFQFVGLPSQQFVPYFALSEEQLRGEGIRRMIVDAKPGYPFRVSLADAEVGETVLLLPYLHHDVTSPYRASGPIFVRRDVPTATPAVDEIPLMFRHRVLSVRAYDGSAMMVEAQVVRGTELDGEIRRLLSQDRVTYLHVHNAGPGCFNCRVDRA